MVMYAMEKFRPYLLCSKVIVYTDHSALKHLLEKKDVKLHLIRWILLLQEFNLKIKDKAGTKNVIADHLFRLIVESHDALIDDAFPDEHLMAISTGQAPWLTNFANFLASRILPHDLSSHQRKKFLHDIKTYFWEEPFLYKLCKDGIYRRCLPEEEINSVIVFCHNSPCGGHSSTSKTATKVLQVGFFWPLLFKDVHDYVCFCDRCQWMAIYLERMRCPLTSFLKLRSLMFGASTSWAISYPQGATSTFWSQ